VFIQEIDRDLITCDFGSINDSFEGSNKNVCIFIQIIDRTKPVLTLRFLPIALTFPSYFPTSLALCKILKVFRMIVDRTFSLKGKGDSVKVFFIQYLFSS